MDEQNLFLHTMNYWTLQLGTDPGLLKQLMIRNNRMILLEHIQDSLRLRSMPDPVILPAARRIWNCLFGQVLLDHLLSDPRVTDIKVLAYNQIRLKCLGVRRTSDFHFQNRDQYLHFTEYLLQRNGLKLEETQSVVSFCDTGYRPEDILCFHISSRRINAVNTPYLHLRRIPKRKKSLQDLSQAGMLSPEASSYLQTLAQTGSCILFTGSCRRDQKILMNALLELIPHSQSALAIQEQEELFSLSHPEILFQHTAPTSRSEIPCDTRELMEYGLLLDSDYFILDELTQKNALPFWKAVSRGCSCWTCVPANTAQDALLLLADYLSLETRIPVRSILPSFVQLFSIITVQEGQVADLLEISSWDADTGSLTLMCPPAVRSS